MVVGRRLPPCPYKSCKSRPFVESAVPFLQFCSFSFPVVSSGCNCGGRRFCLLLLVLFQSANFDSWLEFFRLQLCVYKNQIQEMEIEVEDVLMAIEVNTTNDTPHPNEEIEIEVDNALMGNESNTFNASVISSTNDTPHHNEVKPFLCFS